MLLRDVIDSPCGLRYMLETLEVQSGAARRRVLESSFMSCPEDIRAEYEHVADFYELGKRADRKCVADMQNALSEVKDIRGTIGRLAGGHTADEVELYEIKLLALLSGRMGRMLNSSGISTVALPDLSLVEKILDPDGQRVATFYIYDSYSPKLAEFRKQIRAAVDDEQREELMGKSLGLEAEIRKELSRELSSMAENLNQALNILLSCDIWLAKALQMQEMGLCFPDFSNDGYTRYEELFHPQVKDTLERKGISFQPVTFGFGGPQPTTIIGANMGGKTVVLKMTALAQYLFQFGFGIPARSATIDIKESVVLSVGDRQTTEGGLSSFGAEVKEISSVAQAARSGRNVLALIDEPARTTNPTEGTALAAALVNIMNKRAGDLILTTHYDLREVSSRMLRVKGIVKGTMDYSLMETTVSEAPREALNIAAELGADSEWLEEAARLLGNPSRGRNSGLPLPAK